MSSKRYPFSAVVDSDDVKLALLLVAVDPAIGGVLLRGDKGTAKTTLARGLATLLPGDAPFVDLPLGATEDRVVGTLDLAAALRGAGTGVVAVTLVGVRLAGMLGGRAGLLAIERLVLRIDGLRCTVSVRMWLTVTEGRTSIVGRCTVEPDGRVVLVAWGSLSAWGSLGIGVSLD